MKKKAIAILLALMLTLCFASATMAFAWPELAAASDAAQSTITTPGAGDSTFIGVIMIGLSVVASIANRKNDNKK
ncbi:MAG: hypothetical protein Q4E65_06055 [Clostridia bacterium]|nr:hypothetical protein [Clostridia bacterium]